MILFYICQKFRDELPINRRLNNAEQQKVRKYYAMGCNKPGIRQKMQEKTGKKIYRKDLDNIIKKGRNADDDTLDSAINYLVNEHGKFLSFMLFSLIP